MTGTRPFSTLRALALKGAEHLGLSDEELSVVLGLAVSEVAELRAETFV
jgi:hypothetical protein